MGSRVQSQLVTSSRATKKAYVKQRCKQMTCSGWQMFFWVNHCIQTCTNPASYFLFVALSKLGLEGKKQLGIPDQEGVESFWLRTRSSMSLTSRAKSGPSLEQNTVGDSQIRKHPGRGEFAVHPHLAWMEAAEDYNPKCGYKTGREALISYVCFLAGW